MAGGSRETGRTTTSRALAVLGAFEKEHTHLSLSQIARRAGLSLSTTHRLVRELLDWGALDKEQDGRLAIGLRLWQVGLLSPVHQELREVALPHLQDVHSATRATVHLAVREGIHALYVERLGSSVSARVASRMGGRLPLHVTGAGRALLAWAPREVQDRAMRNLVRFTEHTVMDPVVLRDQLVAVRRNGYAHSVQQTTLGIQSVAVPVCNLTGTVVAGLGAIVPITRPTVMSLVPVLQVAARSIGRHLV